MQAFNIVLVLGTVLLAATDAGYYKRPPPPSKLHYLPKPPHHHYRKPPPYYPHRPNPIHPPRNPIRPPPRPFISKPTPPPPPPFPPASWKTNHFRAPVVKEQFHSSPLAFAPEVTQHFLQDDDKGPIHTIPAPDLSQADRHVHHEQDTSHNSALNAVLNHAEAVRSKPTTLSYQVTEDPSAYKPYSGSASYFAPDPDPSLPTIEVPQTTDPHSVPSNGVAPLDLYQQHVADQQTQQVYHTQYADGGAGSSTLSPQDLYQLFHGSQQQMTPQLYQQYLQAATAQQPASAIYQQVFQAGLLYPQQYQQPQVTQYSQQNFQPQYETFNYNEQTQESAHGSDSFPSASSINIGVKRAVNKETSVSGEGHSKIPGSDYLDKATAEESNEVGVISNQVDYEEEEEQSTEDLAGAYYTTLPNKQAADALATLAAAGSINNQLVKGQENKVHYSIKSVQEQHENEQTQQSRREEQRAEEERRQQEIRKVEQERENEIRKHEEQREQIFRNQEIRLQEQNRNIYSNHAMGGGQEIKQQIIGNKNMKETQGQSGKDNIKQMFTDSDYNEDEILDTSDKDQRMRNSHMQQSSVMRPYNTPYFRQKNEKENESQTEEQSYEDADDYSQEEVKEINNTNKMAKPVSVPEKSVSYNTQQNQLPFGAKLRPKRV